MKKLKHIQKNSFVKFAKFVKYSNEQDIGTSTIISKIHFKYKKSQSYY